MRIAALAVITAACAEPVVEMQLVLPQKADTFNTSCVTSVEVRAMGASFAQNRNDYTKSCIDVSNKASFSALHGAIRGQFDLVIPDSGLGGIAMYGWSGPTACEQSDTESYFTPDLVFFGRAEYIGQDQLDIPLTPNLNCARKPVKVRIVDGHDLATAAQRNPIAVKVTEKRLAFVRADRDEVASGSGVVKASESNRMAVWLVGVLGFSRIHVVMFVRTPRNAKRAPRAWVPVAGS